MPVVGERARRILFAVIAVGALAGCFTGLRDPDMFHHLAYGRYVAQHGLPLEDPFLYPMAGTPVGVMPHWLGAVAIYIAWIVFGALGPLLLVGATAAAILLLMLAAESDRLREKAGLFVALLPITLAFFALQPRLVPRTEVFALLFLAATLWMIGAHERGRERALWLFPPLALLWTNVHGSLPIGLAAIGAYVGEGLLLRAWRRSRPLAPGAASTPLPPLRTPIVVAFLGLAAGLVTPSSPNPTLLAIRFALATVMGTASSDGSAASRVLPILRHNVTELRPFGVEMLPSPVGLLLLLAAGSFLLVRRRGRLRDALLLGALVVMLLQAQRYMAFASVVAGFAAVRNLLVGWKSLPPSVVGWRWSAHAAAFISISVGAILTVLNPWKLPFGASLSPGYPATVVDYMRANGVEGPIFNTFHLGGFLEWEWGRPVFQDGRGLLPPGLEEAALEGTAKPSTFIELDRRYRFEALVVVHPQFDAGTAASFRSISPATDWNVSDRGRWALVAFDDGASLYLRRDGRHSTLIARDEYRYAHPSNAPDLIFPPGADSATIAAEGDRSVRAAPSCRRCRLAAATGALKSGNHESVEALLPDIVGDPTVGAAAESLLAQSAEARGDLRLAVARLDGLLGHSKSPGEVRNRLAQLRLKLGEPQEALRVLAPNLAGTPTSLDLAYAGAAARALGRVEDARAFEERMGAAVTLDSAKAHFERGLSYTLANLPALAAREYRLSLEANEASAPAHTNLGFALMDTGDLRGAVEEFRRAGEIEPSYANARYGLAETYERLGDRALAVEAWRAYLRLEPRGRWAKRAEDAVARLRPSP